MRMIPTQLNGNKSQPLKSSDFCFNDTAPIIDQGDTLQDRKPLPKVPSEMLHISPISGGSTTWTDESFDPSQYSFSNNQQSYYQPYNFSQQSFQQYYYPQQPYYDQYQRNSLNSNTSNYVTGSDWRMSNTELQRSDSLKIQETTVPNSRYLNPLETHMEKPFEPPTKIHRKMSKQELESVSTSSESEEEDPAASFSAAENFFSHPDSSTTSVPNVTRSSSFDMLSNPVDKAEAFYDCHSQHKLSIASCSLINDKSNIKLYRRMAIKTRSTDTQLAYAKYLIQISKLYNHTQPVSMKTKHTESPSQIKHRLLLEAGYWIEKLAKLGLPEALFIQGKWYLLGSQADDCVIYSKSQETKALRCFVRASSGGWADAHYELAKLWKKKGNFKRAVHYYDIGAKDNHTLSIYKMAKIYLRGQLKVDKDVSKGLDYLLRAANMDDPDSAEAAFVIGCIYAKEFNRIGVDRYDDSKPIELLIESDEDTNDSLALKYLRKSACYNYVDAIYFMGQAFEKGFLGQPMDPWQAYQYYMKAAEMDHPEAMVDLSRTYFQGIPGRLAIQHDFAFKWCKRSADLGFDKAEYVLGQYFEDGVGVLANFALALEYFGKAASKGYKPAAEKLNRPISDERKNTPDENEQVYFLKNNVQTKNNSSDHSNNHCMIQ